jgi:flagellar biogenesis protein FliO
MTFADHVAVSKNLGKSLGSTDNIQTAEVEDEALVESVAEAVSNTPLFEDTQIHVDQNEQAPTNNTEKNTSANVVVKKSAQKDVYGKQEAPFDMMSPESPDLSQIR